MAESIIVQYGNASIPWYMLTPTPLSFGLDGNSKFLELVSPDDAKVLQLFSRVGDINRFRECWRKQDKGLDLLSLLRRFSHRQSSDSRDKVFGLLGMCDPARTLRPNYTWDEATGYEKYLVEMIRNKGSLAPLHGFIGRKGQTQYALLASRLSHRL